jgi:predicted acyltransferase
MTESAAGPPEIGATIDRSKPTANPAERAGGSARLTSIDALRGFDMFWITGGEAAVAAWLRAVNPSWKDQALEQLEHVEWEGFRFYDLIFPLFLFLVGVVLPISLGKIRDSGGSIGSAHLRILRRTALLVLLGLIANGLLNLVWPMRVAGVLQRIGICYGLTAFLTLHLSARGRAVAFAVILLGYQGLLAGIPSPETGIRGDYSKEGNLCGWMDRKCLPGKIMPAYYGFGDNEGLLSTLPAVATVLLGTFAGDLLRRRLNPFAAGGLLMLAGGVCLGVAWAWSHPNLPEPWRMPVIKILWTGPYVLMAGGFSLLLLGTFHALIDGVGAFRRLAFPLVVIGSNAILIYMLPRFIDFKTMSVKLFGGLARVAGEPWTPALTASGAVLLGWLLLLYLHRQKIFLRA